MPSSLASHLSTLSLTDQSLTGTAFDTLLTAEEDGSYHDSNQRPRKRSRQSPEEIKSELENEFLTPSARFGGEWLGRLQRFVLSFSFVYMLLYRQLITLFKDRS